MDQNNSLNILLKSSPSSIGAYLTRTPLRLERKDRINLLRKHTLNVLTQERNGLLNRFQTNPADMKWDELYALSHLRMFEKYGEFQWEYNLARQKNKTLNLAYATDFLMLLIETLLRLPNGQVLLDTMEKELSNKLTEIDVDIIILNRAFDSMMNDEEKTLDGMTFPQFRSVMYVGSTVQELRKLAEKYHVNIPKYISKQEIQRRLIDALTKSGNLTDDKKSQIEQASIKQLLSLGDTWNLNAKTYMTKEEIIEYILEHAEPTRNYYEKPTDVSVYYEETIKAFKQDYQNLMVLTIATVALKDLGLLEQALQRLEALEDNVKTKLNQEKTHFELLLNHLRNLSSMPVQPVISLPTPSLAAAPIVNSVSMTQSTITESHKTQPSIDLKPYLDRIDQGLLTQQQLLLIIQQLIAQTKPGENTVVNSSVSNLDWFRKLSILDLGLGLIILIQIVWLLATIFN